MQIPSDAERIATLEQEVRVLNRTLTGQRHWLKVAAEYRSAADGSLPVDLGTARTLAGIQAALGKAAEYEPRQQQRGRQR